jgi:glutathione S-transferase
MNLRFIEEELGKSTWFAGEEVTGAGPYPWRVTELTNVDIMMSFPVQLGQVRATTTGSQFPRMKEFIARMEARPAYQRAVAKGGPLEIVA